MTAVGNKAHGFSYPCRGAIFYTLQPLALDAIRKLALRSVPLANVPFKSLARKY